MDRTCPVCGEDIVAFTDLLDDVRDRLEDDPQRQRRSVARRRRKHTPGVRTGDTRVWTAVRRPRAGDAVATGEKPVCASAAHKQMADDDGTAPSRGGARR